MICWWMSKTSCKAKTTPRNPLINNQAVISMRNLTTTLLYSEIPTYSWTFVSIPNWTRSCNRLLRMHRSSTWLTPTTWLTVIGCKILHFKDVEDQVAFGYKTLRCTKSSSFSQSIWVLSLYFRTRWLLK